ncbi:hypothetical protein KIW84_074213 [Lathyrus oleraceus]|uniref:Uncharacterized protein n=1 Tax=Pisum sativum TaxID=3888 RepID=A0A9D4VRQ2_PEA|nr:hypothetical protein KIW84_074213 [Pisum sativum]
MGGNCPCVAGSAVLCRMAFGRIGSCCTVNAPGEAISVNGEVPSINVSMISFAYELLQQQWFQQDQLRLQRELLFNGFLQIFSKKIWQTQAQCSHCPDAFPPQFCARVRGIDSKSNGSSCEFIDDSSNIETDNDIGIRGGLSLSIIEISWGGNDIITNCLAKECFGGFLHLFDASSLSHTYEA